MMIFSDLEAGPALDGLIARQVMGQPDAILPYSTDLPHAWRVVERLRRRTDGHFTLLAFTTNWRAGWRTPETNDVLPDTLDEVISGDHLASFQRFVAAPTAPLAICRAALQFVYQEQHAH